MARLHTRLKWLPHLRERDVERDGNCLFRALAIALGRLESQHGEVRAEVVSHLRAFRGKYFSFVVDSPFDAYVGRMSFRGVWGGHLELQAAADLYGINIHLLTDLETHVRTRQDV